MELVVFDELCQLFHFELITPCTLSEGKKKNKYNKPKLKNGFLARAFIEMFSNCHVLHIPCFIVWYQVYSVGCTSYVAIACMCSIHYVVSCMYTYSFVFVHIVFFHEEL